MDELQRTLLQGKQLYVLETDKPITPRRLIWRLLQEAAHTERILPYLRPSTKVTSWPEYLNDPANLQEIVREQELEKVKVTPRPIRADPEAIERYVVVMDWYRYIRSTNIPRARQTLMALAGGMSLTKATYVFGFESRRAVESSRNYSVDCIHDKLKKLVPVGYFSSLCY